MSCFLQGSSPERNADIVKADISVALLPVQDISLKSQLVRVGLFVPEKAQAFLYTAYMDTSSVGRPSPNPHPSAIWLLFFCSMLPGSAVGEELELGSKVVELGGVELESDGAFEVNATMELDGGKSELCGED